MESPSARRWLGVGAALSGLPAAGGCFCAALLLALVADSDPGAVSERAWWLGAAMVTGAGCAFAAMLGWVTLQRGGVPAPVLLVALVVAAVPFALRGSLFLPSTVAALAACAALATYGLGRPPASPRGVRRLSGGLAAAALALTIGQALAVGLQGSGRAARAEVKAGRAAPHAAATNRNGSNDAPDRGRDAAIGGNDAPDRGRDAATGSTDAPDQGAAAPTGAAPAPTTATPAPTVSAPEPTVSAPGPTAAAPAGAERFVRDYYAALDARRFAAAWRMLAPGVQSAFGGFARWRRGYARTVANSPSALRVRPAGAGATVGLTLRAGDRVACGKTVVRRFAVTWQLARTDAGWRATAAAARALSGASPAAAC